MNAGAVPRRDLWEKGLGVALAREIQSPENPKYGKIFSLPSSGIASECSTLHP